MNIYKIKNEERFKLEKEFNKTNFGIRLRYSMTIPLVCAIVSILGVIATTIDKDSTSIETAIYSLGMIVSLLIYSIVSIQYLNMTKDYINSQVKK